MPRIFKGNLSSGYYRAQIAVEFDFVYVDEYNNV